MTAFLDFTCRLALSVACLTIAGIAGASALEYPSRPITMVVPYPAGSTTDATARVLAEQMRSSLGQLIIIENVSGAYRNIGTGHVARATPDGYTIELGTVSTHMMNGAVYSLPYDVVNDFAPISPLETVPGVLFARKTMPAKDLNELIAWLKANPNKASAGSPTTYYRLITAFFQKKPPRNSPLYRTLAAPQQSRTSWQARSTCYSMERTSCHWCGPGA